MDIPTEKRCTACGEVKSLDAFDKRADGKFGRAPQCKACTHLYNLSRAARPKDIPTEKSCRKCKETKPIDAFGDDKYTKDGKATRCLDCKGDETTTFNAANREKCATKTAKWRRDHPEDHHASVERGREKKNTRGRARHAENRERDNANNAAWYEANKEERKLSMKAWDEANPDWHRVKSQRRRSREAAAEKHDLSPEQWQEVLLAFNFRCAYCPLDCKACKNKTHKLHQEHIDPVIKGGSYTLHNIVPSCKSCNSRKGTGKPPVPVQPLLLTIAPARTDPADAEEVA